MKTKLILPIIVLMVFVALATATSAFVVNGTVNGTGNGVVPGATVNAYDSVMNPITTTTTDGNGFYSFEVGSGEVVFNATAAGYDSRITNDDIIADTTINFTLGPIPSVNLTGTVTDGSSPLPNANVTVKIGSGIFKSVSTVGSGNYLVAVENNTGYNGTVTLSGYEALTKSVNIDGNTVLDFNLTQTPVEGTLSGTVNNFTNNSEYIGDVQVTIKQGSTIVESTKTDADGNYTVNVPGGTYTVVASKVGYFDSTQDNVVVSNGAITDLDFSLIKQGATCTQEGPFYGDWGDCIGGEHSREVTYYNYTGICGNTNVTSVAQNCGENNNNNDNGRSSSGGSPINTGLALPFANYVTHIYDQLAAGKDYIMKIASPEIAIYELEFSVKDDVRRTVTISVGKLLERPQGNLDGEVYEYDVINHQQVSNEEFSDIKARFKVLKEWFEDNDINMSTLALYRYDGGWNVLPTERIDQDEDYYYFESDLPGMSEFAISAKENVYPEETEEEGEVVEELGLSEEEVQELMDACKADGKKPVPVVGESGEVLDIECQEFEEESSVIGRAWGVFSKFFKSSWKWIVIVAIVVVAALLLWLFGPKIFKGKESKSAKNPKNKAPKKKEVELKGITDVNIFTKMWRSIAGRKAVNDEKWFLELDDKEFTKLVKQRKKARLERRKKFLK